MTETTYLGGKVLKRTLPIFQGAPPAEATGPKRLALAQGELANFHDGPDGVCYLAYLELRGGTVRGNHWHRMKEEQVYLISGEVRLVAQEMSGGEQVSMTLLPGDLALIAPGIAHALQVVRTGQAIEFSRTRFDASDTQRFRLI